ncbi:MAG: phospholipase D family protein [Marinobacter sp.]|uniref:phospholipase D family protein n=1 Tax=Marinobacter sp. TaxID=50741 RepID=UPI00349FD632
MSLKIVLLVIFILATGTGIYHVFKPLPQDLSFRGPERPLLDARLLTDMTYRDASGRVQMEHEIFDEVIRLIGQAEKLIVVDMFLFNDSRPDDSYRPLSEQLTEALIARGQQVDGLRIAVITDPLNTFYGGQKSPYFERLRDAGIPVIETALNELRDSNPLWSAGWRLCCQWFGNSDTSGWLPNLMDGGEVTLRSYLALPNFKANHRKVLIVDEAERLRGVITSANPHDGSSKHSNVALSFTGPAVNDLLVSEQAVLALSGATLNLAADVLPDAFPGQVEDTVARVVTEAKILDSALAMVNSAPKGAKLDLAMFYLAHRELVTAFIEAHDRGVNVRVLLDPNKEAFGHEKSGIPNRQVAMELTQADITVRWCNTHGEQCHSKMLIRHDPDDRWQLLMGSANFTRRNLDDLNLETDILVRGSTITPLFENASSFFDRQWQAGPGKTPALSLPYETYADHSRIRYWRYRFMETTGLSTF